MPSSKQTLDPELGAGALAPIKPPESPLLIATEAGNLSMHPNGPQSQPAPQSSGYSGGLNESQ